MIYEPPQDTSVTETGTAVFNCSVSGQANSWSRVVPTATQWHTGPHPLLEAATPFHPLLLAQQNLTSQLSISTVTPMDGGTYVCRANSGGVTYSSSTAVLTVLGKIVHS